MGVVVARMVASLEAETSRFHSRMTAAETQLTRWSSATVSGRRATMVLNNSLQQLAFQAASIPGPLGKAASAIGVLGLGTGPVFLAVAALGALALVWKQVDSAATLAAENVTSAAERMHRNITTASRQAAPEIFASAIADVEARRAALAATPLGGQRRTFIPGPPGMPMIPINVGSPEQDRRDALGVFDTQIAQLRVGLAASQKRVETPDFLRDRAQERLEADMVGGLGGARTDPFMKRIATSVVNEMVEGGGKTSFTGEKVPSFMDPLQLLEGKNGKPRVPGFQFTPEFGVMSAAALLQGAQGGASGLFGAAAGPLAMINPLAGAVSSAVGGFFSLFDKKDDERERAAERRHQELIGVLHEGPMRATIILDADSEEQGLYDLRRQERMGGEPRLGGL